MNLAKAFGLASLLFGVSRAQGQSTEATSLAFEAASVKPSGFPGQLLAIRIRGGRLMAESASAMDLITDADQIQPYQLSGAPKWFGSAGSDIEAVAGSIPTRDQFRLMLQTLLADRFQLKFHKENLETEIYGLVAGKNGVKFHELKNGAVAPGQWGSGHIHFRDLSMVAAALSRFSSDRPVVDKTGLTDTFDLEVNTSLHSPPVEGGHKPTAGENLLEATLDQLGLKLILMKAPVEMFVIDSVEKPAAN